MKVNKQSLYMKKENKQKTIIQSKRISRELFIKKVNKQKTVYEERE